MLGSIFSDSPHPFESDLVKQARVILEMSVACPPALLSLDAVTAWILRTLYLRCMTRPHISWMAICTTMHISEAVGLHQEFNAARFATLSSPIPLGAQEIETQRRMFWSAWLLNRLFAAEYGRSRVDLENIGCMPISSRQDDFTPLLIELAEVLPDEYIGSVEDFDVAFKQLFDVSNLPSTFELIKADICFHLYRRLRLSKINIVSEHVNIILSIIRKALVECSALSNFRRPR